MNNESREPVKGVKPMARKMVSPPLYTFTWWAKKYAFFQYTVSMEWFKI